MNARLVRVARALLASVLLVASVAAAGQAAAMSARGSSGGKAVLRFSGPKVSAALSASLVLSGAWVEGGRTVSFSAQGTVLGSADVDLATLTGFVWATFLARGTTADGQSIEIRGALAGGGQTALKLGAGAVTYVARHVLVIRRARGDLTYAGTVTGQLSGTFVNPEDPSTMQAAGAVTLELSGEPTGSPLAGLDAKAISAARWDATAWPDEVSKLLLCALGWTATAPQPPKKPVARPRVPPEGD